MPGLLEVEVVVPESPPDDGAMAHDINLNNIDIEHNAGAGTRFDNNLRAIVLLKQLDEEGRKATPSEQVVLAKYSGFGDSGFNPAFPVVGDEGKKVKQKRVKAHFVSREEAINIQKGRSLRSQSADSRRTSKATVTPDVGSRWANNPGRYDYPGVDTQGRGAIKRGLLQIKNAAGTVLTRKKHGGISGKTSDIPGTKSRKRRRK